jgi:hypothetical protein
MNGNLSTHLYRFNIFMEKWIVELPDISMQESKNPMFSGCIRMQNLYQELILNYFRHNDKRPDMYLDDKLSTLNLKGQKIDDTFRIITETYRMHLFIAGALSDARIFDLSISLYKRFAAEIGTKEQALTQHWPITKLEQVDEIRKQGHDDVILTLVTRLQDIAQDVLAKVLTAYEIAQTADALNSTTSRVQFNNTPQVQTVPYTRKPSRRYAPDQTQAIQVHAAQTQETSPAAGTSARPTPELCLCGKPGHTPQECKSRKLWPAMSSLDIDRALHELQRPESQNFRPKIAEALSILRPGRGGHSQNRYPAQDNSDKQQQTGNTDRGRGRGTRGGFRGGRGGYNNQYNAYPQQQNAQPYMPNMYPGYFPMPGATGFMPPFFPPLLSQAATGQRTMPPNQSNGSTNTSPNQNNTQPRATLQFVPDNTAGKDTVNANVVQTQDAEATQMSMRVYDQSPTLMFDPDVSTISELSSADPITVKVLNILCDENYFPPSDRKSVV